MESEEKSWAVWRTSVVWLLDSITPLRKVEQQRAQWTSSAVFMLGTVPRASVLAVSLGTLSGCAHAG